MITQQLNSNCNYILAMGSFDGVHHGHQAVIAQTIQYAQEYNLTPAIMTFQTLPATLMSKYSVQPITNIQERQNLFQTFGIANTLVLDFELIKSLSPKEYIINILQASNIKMAIAGSDHCFGHKRQGNIQLLEQFMPVQIIEFQNNSSDNKSDKISSSTIRQLLQNGQIITANKLLNYDFFLTLEQQITGTQIATNILQTPTLNFSYPDNKIKIKTGVYCGLFNNQECLINYGIAPSAKNLSVPILEIHLLNINPDKIICYPSSNNLELHYYIRSEKKFNTLIALQNQIQQDITITNDIFSQRIKS